MTDYQTKMRTLDAHGIAHKLKNGKLWAEEVYTVKYAGHVQTSSDWVDVSEFTTKQLMAWLGY